MNQIANTDRVLNSVRYTVDSFRRALAVIDYEKNDNSSIFKDVRDGSGNLFDIKPFTRDSASDSIYFGVRSDDTRFFTNPVTSFVKAYRNKPESEGLRVETCMYKNSIMENIAFRTPHVVHHYGSILGLPLIRYTSDEIYNTGKKALRDKLDLVRSGKHNWVFNFTEYLPMAKSPDDFFTKPDLSITFTGFLRELWRKGNNGPMGYGSHVPQILFQILYTLYTFSSFGVYHNDLHTSNMLIVKNTTRREFIYAIPKPDGSYTHVYMLPEYIVKIFDYDRGYDEDHICFPDSGRAALPLCYRGKGNGDCYENDRHGYDFLRMITSTSLINDSFISSYIGDDLNTVRRKFSHLTGGSGAVKMAYTGYKGDLVYLLKLAFKAQANGWFQVKFDDSPLHDYPNAELYYIFSDYSKYLSALAQPPTPTVSPTPTVPPTPTVSTEVYTREQLEKKQKSFLIHILNKASVPNNKNMTKERLIKLILRERLVVRKESKFNRRSLDAKRLNSLRSILTKYKLPVQGNKLELVQRILDNQSSQTRATKPASKPASNPASSSLYTEEYLKRKTVRDLANILRKRKLPVSGVKAALIQRILSNRLPAAPIVAPIVAPIAAPIVAPIAAPIVAPIVAPIAAPIVAPIAAPAARPKEYTLSKAFIRDYKDNQPFSINPFTGRKIKMLRGLLDGHTQMAVKVYNKAYEYLLTWNKKIQ